MALSAHADVLALSKTRLEGLSIVGPTAEPVPVVRREHLQGSWGTALPAYPLLLLSGYGMLRNLHNEQSCTFDLAYPIVIVYVDRRQAWSADDAEAQQAIVQQILDGFIQKPLAMTYTGARCLNVDFMDGITIEKVDEAWQVIWRQLSFEAIVRQTRT